MLMEQLVAEAQKLLRENEKDYDNEPSTKKPVLTAVVKKRVDTNKGPQQRKKY